MIIQQNSMALVGKKTAHEAEGHLGSGTIFLVKAWTLFHSGVCTCALTDSSAYLLWAFLEPSWSHWLENWILLPAGDSFILLENFNDSETGGSWRGWTEYEPEWSFVIGLLRSPQTVHNNKIHGHMSSTLECRKGPKSQSLSPSDPEPLKGYSENLCHFICKCSFYFLNFVHFFLCTLYRIKYKNHICSWSIQVFWVKAPYKVKL